MLFRLFAVIVITVFALPAQAGEQVSKRVMVIGSLSAPPYVYVDPNGKPSGILVHKVTQALERLGIQPVYEISNWSRSYMRVKEGKIDAVLPTLKRPDREQFLSYPEMPVAYFNMVIAKSMLDPRTQTDLDDLAEKAVGRIRDSRVTPAFEAAANANKFILEDRASFGELALGVASQRLDYAVGPELMLMWGAGENGVLDQLAFLDPPLGQGAVYLALSKASPFIADIKAISDSLHDVDDSYAFKETLRPYSTFLNLDLYDKLREAADVHQHNAERISGR